MRKSFIVVFTCAFLLLCALIAFGQEADVKLAGYTLFRMRCPSAGYSISERAAAIQRRANDLLTAEGIDLSTVKVVPIGNEAAIYVAGNLLVTVDNCTAKANGTTPIKLANIWADRLKKIYPVVVPKNPNEPKTHVSH